MASPGQEPEAASPPPTPRAARRAPIIRSAPPETETSPRLESRYAYLTQHGNQALCLFEQNDGCVYLSENWKTLTGRTPQECLGSHFFNLVHPSSQAKLLQKFEKLAHKNSTGKNAAFHFKCQIMHADGKWYWYSMDAARTLEDNSCDFACVLRNIQQELLTEKRLQKAKLEAELALKGRSEFLANMSHELRTPLNAVLGFAQMMQNQLYGKIGNPKYLEYLENIHESGNALLAKINDLLELSNIEAGKISLVEENSDIIDVIRYAIEIQSHNAFAAQVSIRESLIKGPLMVRADRVKLKQTISNILCNAIKFSKAESEVTLSMKVMQDGALAITITDHGIGIAPRQLRNILDTFAEEDGFFVKNVQGVGLGLALSKEYITLHGGDLQIESKEGVGTRVSIVLPKERVLGEVHFLPTSRRRASHKG